MWVSHDNANGKCDAFSCAVEFAAHIENMTPLNEGEKMFCKRNIQRGISMGTVTRRRGGAGRNVSVMIAGPDQLQRDRPADQFEKVSVVTNV